MTDVSIVVGALDETAVPLDATEARGPWSLVWRRLIHDKVAILSAAFIVLLVAFAMAAPLFESWTGHDKNRSNTAGSDALTLLPVGPMTGCDGLGSVGEEDCFVFGASNVSGYDMLVQLSYGARTSLFIGLVATALTVVVALVTALVAGYLGGLTDNVLSRVMDIIAAFPFLLFAIAMSVAFGTSMGTVIMVIVLFSWFYPARLFRGQVLSLREREFVDAAKMLGASTPRILRKHILPHLIGPAIVYSTLAIAAAILFEAALSYLGFGLPVDIPSWGRMISDAVPGGLYRNAPHLMLFPGSLLVLTVLAFNLLGDGLRDALDPRGHVDR
jgi:ABC-type dipeptide/oligopeptide/nickel transport system permease subunit